MLEDLKIRGFVPIDRYTEELTVDHVALYLKAVAKYHAISMAVKDQQPEIFQKFTANLRKNIFQRHNELLRNYFDQQVANVISLFSTSHHGDAALLVKLKEFFNRNAVDIFVDGVEAEANESAVIVSYGDANLNNTMFRYRDDDDGNRKPIEICMLDWQSSRPASPVTDIVFYMFACVTKEVRDAHYEHLLEIYHEMLSAHIRRL